jgi:ribosomal protein S18 acetylase RimI-like enzyme
VSEEFDARWFDLYCISETVSSQTAPVRQAILERISARHGFVILYAAGAPAAVGMGVVEAGWLGIFSMATLPAYRRRGAARAILRTLAVWAQLYEARHAYLQVMEHNLAAQTLYADAGFATAYRYHYRVKG